MGRRGGGSEARKRDATECGLDAHRGRFGQEDEARDDVLSHSSTRECIWKSGCRFFTPRISCTPLVRRDEFEISQRGDLWPSKLGP